jgi:hypothetical protein
MHVTDPDPDWFNAHPHRRHRVRPLSLAEILQGVPPAPEGCIKLAAVRRVAALKLMTLFYTVDCADLACANLDEEASYEIFEQALSVAPPHLEAQLRGGLGMSESKSRRRGRLSELVEKAVESDRLYFERHPHRKHRIRRSHVAEILELEFTSGEPHNAPPGWQWHSVVKQVCPNVRGRLFVLNRQDAETDLTEEVCRLAYERLQTPGHSEFEEKIRTAMSGGERT